MDPCGNATKLLSDSFFQRWLFLSYGTLSPLQSLLPSPSSLPLSSDAAVLSSPLRLRLWILREDSLASFISLFFPVFYCIVFSDLWFVWLFFMQFVRLVSDWLTGDGSCLSVLDFFSLDDFSSITYYSLWLYFGSVCLLSIFSKPNKYQWLSMRILPWFGFSLQGWFCSVGDLFIWTPCYSHFLIKR